MFLSVLDRFLSINVLLGINTCYLVRFRGYGRLILQKYDVFNSIQFILIVFWGKAWLCLPPRSPDMNTRTGLAPTTLPVHLMNESGPGGHIDSRVRLWNGKVLGAYQMAGF